MGEMWSMDFTAMTLRESHDKNRVGVLFEESISEVQLSGPMVPDDGRYLMGQNVIGWFQAYDPERNQADWNGYVSRFSSFDGQALLVESFMNLDSDGLESCLVPEEVLPDEESKVDSGDSKEEDLFVGGKPQVDSSGERMVIEANSARGDASSEEGSCLLTELIEELEVGDDSDKKFQLKKLGDDINIAKDGEVGRGVESADEGGKDEHLPKKAREAKRAAKAGEIQNEVVEEDNLTWEERDIMRGLGISGLHYVSSSTPVTEMVSWLSAKVCQMLVEIENHLRDKEGRPFKSQIDELSRAAMNAVLDSRNDDAVKHSEAFKDLFHVYATKVVKIKDVIKDLSTNGWKDPMIAERKRILVDFPCLEALNSLPVEAKIVELMWAGSPDAVKIMCSMCLQLDMSMEERCQAGGYLHAECPDDAEPVYVRVPDYLNEILVDSPELVPVSPECIDGDGHEYLSMLLKIDRKAGTMTFRMPKLFKKLKALLESMRTRARKKAKFARRERRVKYQVYSDVRKGGGGGGDDIDVRTPMALDNSSIYEPSSVENPIVPYDVVDSRRILGLAACIILGIRPDAVHAAAIVARFTGSKRTEAVIDHCVRLAWYLVDTEDSCVLTYKKSPDGLDLTGMMDASFANDPLDKRVILVMCCDLELIR